MLLLVNQSSCQAYCFCNILICSYLRFSLFFIYIFSGASLLSDIPILYLLFPYLFLVVQLYYCFHLQSFFVTISISCVCSSPYFWALFFSVLFLLYYYGNFLMENSYLLSFLHLLYCQYFVLNLHFCFSFPFHFFRCFWYQLSSWLESCFFFLNTFTCSVSSLPFLSINLLVLYLLLNQF